MVFMIFSGRNIIFTHYSKLVGLYCFIAKRKLPLATIYLDPQQIMTLVALFLFLLPYLDCHCLILAFTAIFRLLANFCYYHLILAIIMMIILDRYGFNASIDRGTRFYVTALHTRILITILIRGIQLSLHTCILELDILLTYLFCGIWYFYSLLITCLRHWWETSSCLSLMFECIIDNAYIDSSSYYYLVFALCWFMQAFHCSSSLTLSRIHGSKCLYQYLIILVGPVKIWHVDIILIDIFNVIWVILFSGLYYLF